ncbi:MAG: hypothetical protein ACLFWG_00160 [Longimicrobiales bacterium]
MSDRERDRDVTDGEGGAETTTDPLRSQAREWTPENAPRVRTAEIAGGAVTSSLREVALLEREVEVLRSRLDREHSVRMMREWDQDSKRRRVRDLEALARETLARFRNLAEHALEAAQTTPRPSRRTNVRRALERLEEIAETDLRWLEERGPDDG